MFGNLRKLGNMVLNPFGLSTENFQFVKNEDNGSYSVNFKQNNSSWWLLSTHFVRAIVINSYFLNDSKDAFINFLSRSYHKIGVNAQKLLKNCPKSMWARFWFRCKDNQSLKVFCVKNFLRQTFGFQVSLVAILVHTRFAPDKIKKCQMSAWISAVSAYILSCHKGQMIFLVTGLL